MYEFLIGVGLVITTTIFSKMYFRPSNKNGDKDFFKLLLKSAKLSKKSYKGFNNPNVLFFDKNDAQAYIWKENNQIYLIFRGTESKNDILTDLNVFTTKISKGVYVHKGFDDQLNSIYPEICEKINSYSDCKNILISGHSLGGALATLSSYRLHDNYPNHNILCHTFGSPRVGNDLFAKLVGSENQPNSCRVYNYEDPVPMTPMSFRFKHANVNNLCLDNNGKFDNINRDHRFWLRPFTSLVYCRFWNPIEPHSIDNYINLLKKNT